MAIVPKNIRHEKQGVPPSIYSSLMRYCLALAVIPMVISSVFFLVSTNSYRIEADRTLGTEVVTQVSSELDHVFEVMTNAGNYIADNYLLQEALKTDFGNDRVSLYKQENALNGILFSTNLLDAELADITVLGANGTEFKSHAQAFINQDHTAQEWYHKIAETQGYCWFPSHEGRFANASDGSNYLTCGRSIFDKSTGDIIGVLIIDFKETSIRKKLLLENGTNGYLMIIDENGQIITSSSGMKGTLTGFRPDDYSKPEGFRTYVNLRTGRDDGQNINAFVAIRDLRADNWKLAGIVASNELSIRLKNTLLLMVAIIVVTIILSILFSLRVSRRIAGPISRLQDAMSTVEEGNLDVRPVQDGSYHEINLLSRQFSHMLDRIKSLVADVYENQQKLRKAELTALQFQINPHFLYNTFDSILWLNRAGKAKDVETMISSLSTFFRIGVSKGESIITVREEILHLTSYLDIQRIRYGDRLDYAIDADENTLVYRTPKLILQPLVENSIYHGIDMNDQSGMIRIRVSEENDKIRFVISDNGPGMPPEQVSELNRFLREGRSAGAGTGYGIRNVSDRLSVIYGDRASIRYESEEGRGTSVTVLIPAAAEPEGEKSHEGTDS